MGGTDPTNRRIGPAGRWGPVLGLAALLVLGCDDGGGGADTDGGMGGAGGGGTLDGGSGGMGGGGAPGDARAPLDAAVDMALPPGDVGPGDDGGCPPGDEGCACGADDACGEDLYCELGVCAACVPGLPGCACVDGQCPDGLACVDEVCRECAADAPGCACDADDACAEDLVCDVDDDLCREPLACGEVGCVPNQRCEAPEVGDATCLEACLPGFDWDGAACVEQRGAHCGAGEGSIAPDCDADLRVCLEVADGAQCGVCVDGHTDEQGDLDTCRPLRTCASLDCAGANRRCVAPPAGQDAACGACADGFRDEGGACAPIPMANCDAGAEASILAECQAQNRACAADGAGARCTTCLDDFVEVGGDCVMPTGSCTPGEPGNILDQCAAENRDCEPVGAGARCGACRQGFVEMGGACVVEAPMCDPVACAALGRGCDDAVGADCGACTDPTQTPSSGDPNSACVGVSSCDPDPCLEGQFCVPQPFGDPPICEDRPCADPDQVLSQTVMNGAVVAEECVTCARACGQAGETGALWPYAKQNSLVVNGVSEGCICETLPGFYTSAAGGLFTDLCDADSDGWVSQEARQSVFSNDPHIAANARCDVHVVDAIAFENEYGQRLRQLFCLDGLTPADEGPCDGRDPVYLFEPLTLDSQPDLERAQPPAYAADGVGRALRAEEVNPLTKACLQGADTNGNLVDDADEHQSSPLDPLGVPEELRLFTQFGYFIELHESVFEPPLLSADACDDDADCPGRTCAAAGFCRERFGTLVIREKSRCADDFPLTYRPEDGDYWRGCTRRRDADWSDDPADVDPLTPVNFDFAQWGCDARTGSCPVPPPPTPALPAVDVPPHGLCDDLPRPPLDGVWRGMNHHSQFKCVTLADQVLDPRRTPQRVTRAQLHDGLTGGLQMNVCHVACPDGDADCALDCAGEACAASSAGPGGATANPSDPVLVCDTVLDPAAVDVNAVGFVAVRHIDPSDEATPPDYVRGCIDEWSPSRADLDATAAWRTLCPGFLGNPAAVKGRGNPANFGKLLCGCNEFYGGEDCDVGCPRPMFGGEPPAEGEADILGQCVENNYCPVGRPGDPESGPSGWWVCADVGRTSVTAFDPVLGPVLRASDDPAGWVLRGGDVRPIAPAAPNCAEGEDCACSAGDADCTPPQWRVR